MTGNEGRVGGAESSFARRYGHWALVAGASEGLGEALAAEAASRGLDVVLAARRKSKLESVKADLVSRFGVSVRTAVQDLSEDDPLSNIRGATEDIEIGLLIYNAAYSKIGPFLRTSAEDHLREIRVNCQGPLSLVHYFGTKMAGRGRGGIVLMSSMTAFQGSPLISNYGATKAYNLVLAEGLWDEFRAQGVDVTACCAGATRTPNYEASEPAPVGAIAPPLMEPAAVAREALAALGKGPSIVPGRANRLASFFLRRLTSRRFAIGTMGASTRKMYSR